MTTETHSPHWTTATKLAVALTLVALLAAALVKFQSIIPPLLIAFILVYLLFPAVSFVQRKLQIKWRLSVSLIYLLAIAIFLSLATVGGFELVQQLQSLLSVINNSLEQIPQLTAELSQKVFIIGNVRLDMSTLDLNTLAAQLLDSIQPVLGQTGSLLGIIASSAFSTLGWTLFILLVSYFMLTESNGLREASLPDEIPQGYKEDITRLGRRLGRIWNAFLRGQIILMIVSVIIYSLVLGIFGVSYAIGLAIMAGLARFLPYIGPAINWAVLALVTFFQSYQPWSMSPFTYMLLVLAIAMLIDSILDNFVSPRILANALRVHPAAVLVAAIVALDLLGLLGVVIAAPILATAKLLGSYILRKMFDMDPWNPSDVSPEPAPLAEQIRLWLARLPLPKRKSAK